MCGCGSEKKSNVGVFLLEELLCKLLRMVSLLLDSKFVLIHLISNWFELNEIAIFDTAMCSKSSRLLFLNCFESGLVILNTTFNMMKIADKQAMKNAGTKCSGTFMRLSISKQQEILFWILERKILFCSVVVFGGYTRKNWQTLFNISSKSSTTITIKNFTTKDHSYDELAVYINRSKRLLNLNLVSCVNMHDVQLMDVDEIIFRNLQQFVAKQCSFRDHAINYLSQFSRTLLTFVYKSYKNRSLKEDTVINLLCNCTHLKSVDIDMRSISDFTLAKVGMFIEELIVVVTERHACHISTAAFTSTLNNCTELSKFKITEVDTNRLYAKNKCSFLLFRNCVAKTIKRLIVSNTGRYNDKHQLILLLESCSNITHCLCLKGFYFFDADILQSISLHNNMLERIWLTRCGHKYNADNLCWFLECCPQIRSVKLFDCPPFLFSVNKFTEINRVEISLTKSTVGLLAEQWTNFNGLPQLSNPTVSRFLEEEDDSEVEYCYLTHLEEFFLIE